MSACFGKFRAVPRRVLKVKNEIWRGRYLKPKLNTWKSPWFQWEVEVHDLRLSHWNQGDLKMLYFLSGLCRTVSTDYLSKMRGSDVRRCTLNSWRAFRDPTWKGLEKPSINVLLPNRGHEPLWKMGFNGHESAAYVPLGALVYVGMHGLLCFRHGGEGQRHQGIIRGKRAKCNEWFPVGP